eukprot:m.198345 g.198345  ORF g.198345 m.198345 type:complete len:142 (-) comp14921_c0_seq1:296-721(-)
MEVLWMWLLALVVDLCLLFFMVFSLLALEEVRTDGRNPNDFAKSLNPYILPEYGVHAVITVLFLLTGNYWSFLVNLCLTGYHIYRYQTRGRKGPGIYEPTEMMSRRVMNAANIECAVKLGFYMLTFFYYLYRTMYALLADD